MPLDPSELDKLKAAFHVGILNRKALAARQSGRQVDSSEDLFTMALALSAAVKKVFFEKSELKFSEEPVLEKRLITRYDKWMRIDATEKFDDTTMLSFVHLYRNIRDLEDRKSVGVIIVYIQRAYLPEMLRLLKYPYIDADDDSEARDGTGAVVNLIGGAFRKELIKIGYPDLEMSHFKSFINSSGNNIEYPVSQKEKYAITFKVDKVKRMVLEFIMMPLSKKSA